MKKSWKIWTAVILVVVLLVCGNAAWSGIARSRAKIPGNMTAAERDKGVQFSYDPASRTLMAKGDQDSGMWMLPFIDDNSATGQQLAALCASGPEVAHVLEEYVLLSNRAVASGKIKDIRFTRPDGSVQTWYFVSSFHRVRRMKTMPIRYGDGGKVTRVGGSVYSHTEQGLLRSLDSTLTMQFDGKGRMSSMKLLETYTDQVVSYRYQYFYRGNSTAPFALTVQGGVKDPHSGAVLSSRDEKILLSFTNGYIAQVRTESMDYRFAMV